MSDYHACLFCEFHQFEDKNVCLQMMIISTMKEMSMDPMIQDIKKTAVLEEERQKLARMDA